MANPLYDVPGLGGYVAQEELTRSRNSQGLQDYQMQQGILAKMQQAQQSQQEQSQIQNALMTSQSEDDAMRKLQAIGTPRAMKIMEDISQAKLRKAQEANALSSQNLHGVQAQQANQNMQQKQQQGAARQGLMQQLTQSQYGGETAPGGPKPQLFQNDQEAMAAMQQAEASGQPFRGDVNNPNVTKALAVGAEPQRAIPELMRQMRPQDPMSAAGRLAPRQIQDQSSPTGWSWQNPTTGEITKGAPVPSTVVGQQQADIRKRAVDYTVGGQPSTGQSQTQPGQPIAPTQGQPATSDVMQPERVVPPAVQDAIKKQTTREVVKSLQENYTRIRDAPQQLESIEKAKSLVPEAKIFQGPLGEQKLWVTKFFNSNTPIKMSTVGVNSAEELRTRIFMNVMDNLKKMDAQPSQLQQQIMQKALGDLGTDPRALSHVLDAYGDAIRDKVGIYQNQVKEAEQVGIRWPHKIEVRSRANSEEKKKSAIDALLEKYK